MKIKLFENYTNILMKKKKHFSIIVCGCVHMYVASDELASCAECIPRPYSLCYLPDS